ncbi:transposase [Deinococcus malanensis]|uniref:Transposase n=1 Tax=Deinococcus malanensis TaxID=1706855 RepID=A0ABQ2EZT6_9DEIO|nr:IS3 family transposase [Deinococcus malanensis]GGK36791.1 transposase [Deinococcus malanensis]
MIQDARGAHPEVSVRCLCRLHDVSRSWYLQRQGTQVTDRDQPLAEEIEAVVLKWSGYGYRRVTCELARRGLWANHKRVLRVMRERRLWCRPKRRHQATTDSAHQGARFPNLLPEMVADRPDQVWQADLTYVRVQAGFVYLACVLDSFTPEIVGWAMSNMMDVALPLTALDNALTARCPPPGLLHHSDQGSQYASRCYIDRLRAMGIRPSMSWSGNPYDNARMETSASPTWKTTSPCRIA